MPVGRILRHTSAAGEVSESVYLSDLMIAWSLCRMEKKLMAKEDWSKLGFSDLERKESQTKQS